MLTENSVLEKEHWMVPEKASALLSAFKSQGQVVESRKLDKEIHNSLHSLPVG